MSAARLPSSVAIERDVTRSVNQRAAYTRATHRVPARPVMLALNERITAMIDTHFRGNVSDAARHLGISQRGLAKLILVDPRAARRRKGRPRTAPYPVQNGNLAADVRSPRPETMSAIVAGFSTLGEDPMWIMTGQSRISTKKLYDLMLDPNGGAAAALSMVNAANARAARVGHTDD